MSRGRLEELWKLQFLCWQTDRNWEVSSNVTGNCPRRYLNTARLQKPPNAELWAAAGPPSSIKTPRTVDMIDRPAFVSWHQKEEIVHLITDSLRLLQRSFLSSLPTPTTHRKQSVQQDSVSSEETASRQSFLRYSRHILLRSTGPYLPVWCLKKSKKETCPAIYQQTKRTILSFSATAITRYHGNR
jgi:hypothetical protein